MISEPRRSITDVIGAIPYRMAFAGGWIDQPFVSRHNPRLRARWSSWDWSRPSGSWNGPAWPPALAKWRWICGMASFPTVIRMELVKQLYAEENRGKPNRPVPRI